MRIFPFCFFLAFLTYSLILFIENVAFNSDSLIELDDGDNQSNANAKDSVPKIDTPKIELDDKKDSLLRTDNKKEESQDSSDNEEEVIKNAISSKGKFASYMYVRNSLIDPQKSRKSKSLQRASIILAKTFSKSFHNKLNEDSNNIENPLNSVNGNENSVEFKKSLGEEIRISSNKENLKLKSNFAPYLLLVALALDGFFEGVALGIQKDYHDVLFLAVGILSHKWAEAFTLGVSFSKSNTEKNLFVKLIIIFSSFTPVGICLGLFLSNLGNEVIEGIFLAMSSGTFIYVAASEVIVEEFAVTKHKYQKFIVYLSGGILVAGLTLIEKLGGREL